ncbi:sodium:calcium antiporter [Candidatus Nitrospira salsa]
MEILILCIALVVILLGAEVFTNALEHLGERLGISEGVTGSIFAAVGTALPETMVPIFAILSSSGSLEVRHEVGVGAILGAPLMLSTLAFVLMAGFAAKKRGWQGTLQPEMSGLTRDLTWFNYVFALGVIAALVPQDWTMVRGSISLMLVMSYGLYLLVTIRASANLVDDGHGTEADHPLYVTKIGLPNHMLVILFQLGFGFILIMLGAKGFVYGVEHLAPLLGISALALSLLVIPLATELPEKVNSVLWIRRGRDTLAFGNITGAMVFQGSLLPALGIFLTPWSPEPETIIGMAITMLAATYLSMVVRSGTVKPYHLLFNGLCYLIFLVSVLRVA